MDYILDIQNVIKVFPGVKALDGVCMSVKKGEIHALVGENGAGKSTLMKILQGIHKATDGQIYYKGEQIRFTNPRAALDAGIAMIHQEISLIQEFDVAENLWFGREKRFERFKVIDQSKRYRETERLLEELKIRLNPRARVKDLSVAQMQLIEVARAVSYNADLIIMDEPTSALAQEEIRQLFQIMRDLADAGKTIIFISHKLDELFAMCDNITVMRDGKSIGTLPMDQITKPKLMNMIAGREINSIYPKTEPEIGDTMLKCEHLFGKGFYDISFEVRKGEILGFCGLMGAGRSEIMRAVFGVDRLHSGEVRIQGRKLPRRMSPKKAIGCGIAMLSEDRLRMGAIHGQSVKDNLSISSLQDMSRMSFINRSKEHEMCSRYVKMTEVRISGLSQDIDTLSGGNQQKIILSRWLMTNPKVLILDEPTRGIDVGAKSEIHRLIDQLAHQGAAIILISSELEEVMGMSDRIIVISNGRKTGEVKRSEADETILMNYAFGLTEE